MRRHACPSNTKFVESNLGRASALPLFLCDPSSLIYRCASVATEILKGGKMISRRSITILILALITAGFVWSQWPEEHGALFQTSLTEENQIPTDPLLGAPRGRTHTLLNGDWNIIIDPQGRGLPGKALGIDLPGYFQDLQSPGPKQLVEYQFDNSETLAVPGDWNSQRDDLFFYIGRVWYQKAVTLTPDPSKRYFLYFGAANYLAHIGVNGTYRASHEGGFTPFNVEVTDQLVDGRNTFVVSVNSLLGDETVPTANTDWFNYGGLTRDVMLISTPKSLIRNYKVELLDREEKSVSVSIQSVAPAGTEVRVALPELSVEETARVDAHGMAEVQFDASFDLWTPENPKLYDLTLTQAGETISDRVGFRTIETRGSEILLNGEPVFLRGISTHEENTLHPGRNSNAEEARALLSLIKELGGNFVRLAHYPHNEHTVRVADELGLMVWAEIPVYWDVDWKSDRSYKSASTQLSELIQRDWNRASVITWSVANETPNTSARLDFLDRLAGLARSLDATRPITAALVGDEVGTQLGTAVALRALNDPDLDQAAKQRIRDYLGPVQSFLLDQAIAWEYLDPTAPPKIELEDPLGDIVDLVGVNEYIGWYYSAFFALLWDLPEDYIRETVFSLMPDTEITNAYGKPLIISETGGGALAGFSDADAPIWSEEYQAKIYQQQIDMVQNSDQLAGMSPWILKDFRSAMRPLNGIQDFWNRKGLVSETGDRKQAFYVLQEFYQTHPGVNQE